MMNPLPVIYVLNGPNLNLLGEREPELYGHTTLADIETELGALATTLSVSVIFKQSNHEGVLIDWLHEARAQKAHGVILNAAGYTHTSVALRDAVLAYGGPVIEVHLSNLHARETFRQHSYLAGVVKGMVIGLGAQGYGLALRALANFK
jgi:3-dehydroquinate dehydratase II